MQTVSAAMHTTSAGGRVLDVGGALTKLVRLGTSLRVQDAAATAQRVLADGVAGMAIAAANEAGIDTIGLSGGVAYNDAIASRIRWLVERADKTYVTNQAVPCGDGGVSFGQAVYAGRGWMFAADRCADVAPG